MGERVHFKILGSLEVLAGQRRLPVGGPVSQRVLAMLLLEHGKAVAISRLVDGAWDGEPPSTAAHQVRKAVAELRRRIPGGPELIHTDGCGYRLVLADPEAELDTARFLASIRRGKQELAAGRARQGACELESALSLWRGPVLLGSGGPVADQSGVVLAESRLQAAEHLIDARLALGECGELIGYIRSLVADQPLREGLRLRLMQALYQAGRPAEALLEYERTCEVLAEQLGADPGAPLSELHQAILTDCARPAAAGAPHGPAGAPPAAPCTLPYDPSDFTGREPELAILLSGGGSASGGSVRIVAIDGMGGCGKTSLAVRAAHRLAPAFPDGQLFVDMHGFTVNQSPRGCAQAMATLLCQLGVPDERIPADEADRSSLLRAVLKDRRVLLVLDNVIDCGQVLPLLPASDACMVIITSRARLAGLGGAEFLSLGPLTTEESVRLVERVLGAARAGAEPDAVGQLCAICGNVPLALRIATARLHSRPNWTVRHLVGWLSGESSRLAELEYAGRSIALTLQLSFQILDPAHREAFRLLPHHPAAEFDAPSAAALFGLSLGAAERMLEALVDVRLLEQPGFGRYALHDIVRTYAASTTFAKLEPGAVDAALQRLFEYYQYVSARACELLFTIVPVPGTPAAVPPGGPPAPETPEQAAGWFDREAVNVLATVERAERSGFFGHCVRLARPLAHFLSHRSRLAEFERVAAVAVSAARMAGAPGPLRVSLVNLAVARWKLGRFIDGAQAAAEALDLAVRLEDRRGEAICLSLIGLFESCLGDFGEADRHLRRAVELHRLEGDSPQETYALVNLSSVLTWTGRHEEAEQAAAAAVRTSAAPGARAARLSALNDLAIARLAQGHVAGALDALAGVLDEGGDDYPAESYALTVALAAEARQKLGNHREAGRRIRQARELLRVCGVSVRQAVVENVLGTVHLLRGEHADALALYQSAYRHASGIGYQVEIGRASAGIDAALAGLKGHTGVRGTAP